MEYELDSLKQVMLEGEYGYEKIVSGVPVMIGTGGAEQIIEMTLNDLQKTRFKNSVESVKSTVDKLYESNFFDDLKGAKWNKTKLG